MLCVLLRGVKRGFLTRLHGEWHASLLLRLGGLGSLLVVGDTVDHRYSLYVLSLCSILACPPFFLFLFDFLFF